MIPYAAAAARLTGSLLLAALPLAALPAAGVQIRAYDPAVHDRFESGYPSDPVVNDGFFQADKELSGIGWRAANANHSYALITPQHFVGARHIQPSVGESVEFLSADGTVKTYTIGQVFNIENDAGEETDLFVAELTQPIPESDGVSPFRFPSDVSELALTGESLVVYGKSARAGTGLIDAFHDFGGDPLTGGAGINTTRTFDFTYSRTLGGPDDARLEVGDSGSPSFIIEDGELALVGTHLAILEDPATVQNFDTSVTHYLDDIDAAIAGSGFQTRQVPEPGTLLLLATGLCALGLGRGDAGRR